MIVEWPLNDFYKLVLDTKKIDNSNLNFNQISKKAGLSSQILYTLESKKRVPRIDNIARIIVASNELGLKLKFDDLFSIEPLGSDIT